MGIGASWRAAIDRVIDGIELAAAGFLAAFYHGVPDAMRLAVAAGALLVLAGLPRLAARWQA